ncbi:MAG: hypothetical protein WCJ19_00885 [bacterium]
MEQNYKTLFKSYDVRGTYPLINGTIAYWVGYSLVKEILEPENLSLKVNIVHDHRLSSNELYKAIYHGIKDAGGVPIPLGLGSTDMLYASCQMLDNAGVMITASHNPPADNGIKIVKKAPQMIGLGSGLEKIRDSIYFSDLKNIEINEFDDVIEETELKNNLLDFFKDKIKLVGNAENISDKLQQRRLKVVVDTGNGMGGFVMEQMLKIYTNIEFIPLYWELDGSYPHHPADPIQDKNVADLKRKVVEENADFGIAFDGDADRAFFIDENGKRVVGDFLMATFAKFQLEKYFSGEFKQEGINPVIVYNQPASRCTPEVVKEAGGICEAVLQGHTYIKAKLLETHGLYGCEHSGHNYFSQFGWMDSGVLAAALFINVLVSKDVKASEITGDLKYKYFLSGEINFILDGNISSKDRLKGIEQKLQSIYPDAEYQYLDGISVVYPEWKVNLRLSNTEPLLRLNIEVKAPGNDIDVKQRLEEIKNLLNL